MLKWQTGNKREVRIKVKWQRGIQVQKVEVTETDTKDVANKRRETKNKMETGVKGSQREMSTLQYQHTHIKLQRLEFKYKDYEYVNDSNDHSGL